MLSSPIVARKRVLSGVLCVSLLLFAQAIHTKFLGEDATVLVGPGDAIFKVCNQSDKTLFLAFVYRHVWKLGEPPTWPVKGWFQLNRSGCQNFAVNGLTGVMSVMYKDSAGVLQPFYKGGDTALIDAAVSNGDSTQIVPELLCLDEPPYSGYRDRFTEYYECGADTDQVPFQILFNAGNNSHFTLTLH